MRGLGCARPGEKSVSGGGNPSSRFLASVGQRRYESYAVKAYLDQAEGRFRCPAKNPQACGTSTPGGIMGYSRAVTPG